MECQHTLNKLEKDGQLRMGAEGARVAAQVKNGCEKLYFNYIILGGNLGLNLKVDAY
jgi:hypothetical protein